MSDLNVTDDDIDCIMQNIGKLEVCGLENHIFDMGTWGTAVYCGTVACAWGSAFYKVYGAITGSGPSEEWINSPYREALNIFFSMSRLSRGEAKIVYDSIDKNGTFNIEYLAEHLNPEMYDYVYYKIPGYMEA